ncbi:MAG: class I SAM-dependent methyltransferase [Promethearchaeota archaeon]
MTSVEKWIKNEAVAILREIGIKKGQTILDFGCGSGIYTILASKIVGNSGKVYALDSNEEGLLDELIDKIRREKIKNIEIIKTSGEIKIPLEIESVDVVLVYDVYHLLNHGEREELVKEIRRVLKKDGLLSYHATHLGKTYNVDLENVHSMMKKYKLQLKNQFKKPMFHWGCIENSLIFNYYKSN